jgi:2-polyprenyl-6-methoxyphenol hydroxylase-like FAD-dependent oxidoreductase
MELYWGRDCQVYVTPVTPDSVCVAAISRNSQFRLADALREFPNLEQRLKLRTPMSTERGAITSSRKLKAVYREHIALIGDASGSVDAITGEGLCLAFRQATALLLLTLGDHPHVRRAAMFAMTSHPGFFAKILAAHVGAFDEMNHSDLSDGDLCEPYS